MRVRVAIGDFLVMSGLSRKALRHYHDLGLLVPAGIDEHTGYRFYDTTQVHEAHVIRRFRTLGMSIPDVKALLATNDVDLRHAIILSHLQIMEDHLRETTSAVTALRELLDPTPCGTDVEVRSLHEAAVWTITTTIDLAEIGVWFCEGLEDVTAIIDSAGIQPEGTIGALYERDLFAEGKGAATMFIPTSESPPGPERIRPAVLPAALVAIGVHRGPSHADIDRSYGRLGTYVTEHRIGRDRPIREHYVGTDGTDYAVFGHTEICWPVIETSSLPS